MERIELSIVLPCLNEKNNVGPLYVQLKDVLGRIGKSYEIIFVDDGSTDGTFEKLAEFYEQDDTVHVVRLRRQFGQTAGLAAGFDLARGEIIIPMDADLQHDPADIPRLLAKIDEGYDIVSGWREKRVDAFLTRRLPSMVANKMMAVLSGVNLHDFGTTFKAYRREVLENVELYGELHRFIPALANQIGVRVAEVPIKNIVRRQGKSKYGLSRTFRVLFDLLTVKFVTSYLARPLHFFGAVGLVFATVGFLVLAILSIAHFFFRLDIGANLASVLFGMLMMILGVQMIGIGLSSEITARTYYQSSGKKIYVIREVLSRRDLTG